MLTFGDGYNGQLAQDLPASSTTMVPVAAAPTGLQSGPFYIVFGTLTQPSVFGGEPNDPSVDYEIVLVQSGQSGTTWTVARGQFGTNGAISHDAQETFNIYTGAA